MSLEYCYDGFVDIAVTPALLLLSMSTPTNLVFLFNVESKYFSISLEFTSPQPTPLNGENVWKT